MQISFLDGEREIMRLDVAPALAALSAGTEAAWHVPGRGEEIIALDPFTGLWMVYGVVQVQRRFQPDSATGQMTLTEIACRVIAIEPSHQAPNLLAGSE